MPSELWHVYHRWPDRHPENPAKDQKGISDVVSATGWKDKETAESVLRRLQECYPKHEIWIEEPDA